jgi:hypothetical protein
MPKRSQDEGIATDSIWGVCFYSNVRNSVSFLSYPTQVEGKMPVGTPDIIYEIAKEVAPKHVSRAFHHRYSGEIIVIKRWGILKLTLSARRNYVDAHAVLTIGYTSTSEKTYKLLFDMLDPKMIDDVQNFIRKCLRKAKLLMLLQVALSASIVMVGMLILLLGIMAGLNQG